MVIAVRNEGDDVLNRVAWFQNCRRSSGRAGYLLARRRVLALLLLTALTVLAACSPSGDARFLSTQNAPGPTRTYRAVAPLPPQATEQAAATAAAAAVETIMAAVDAASGPSETAAPPPISTQPPVRAFYPHHAMLPMLVRHYQPGSEQQVQLVQPTPVPSSPTPTPVQEWTLIGYYSKARRDVQGSAGICDILVITGGSEDLIREFHAGIDQGQRVNLRNDAYQVMMNIDMTTLGPAVQEQVRLSVPGAPVELRVRRAAPPPDPMPPCYSPVEILAVR